MSRGARGALRHSPRKGLTGWGVGLLLGALALSCQSATPEPARPEPARPAPPQTPREALAELMRQVPLQGAPLEALPPKLRTPLEDLVQQLPPEEQAELVSDAGPYPERRPLLHLIAGGASPRAHLTLATSPAGAELLLLTHGTADARVRELLPVVSDLARRAAALWLRERSAALASTDVLTADHYQQVGQAAEALGEAPIANLAFRLAAELDPTAPRSLEHARWAARAGDLDEARRALAQAGDAGPRELRRQTLPVVAAAERLASGKYPAGPSGAAQRLDDLLVTQDLQAAKDFPAEIQLPEGLPAAVLRARLELEGSICPGLPPRHATPLLCRVAFQLRATAAMTEALDTAWASGKGREAEAISGYIGLRFALPFLYGTDVAALPEEAAREVLVKRLGELSQVAREGASASPRVAHVALFAEVLADAVQRPEGASAERSKELVQRAKEALDCAPCAGDDDELRAEWTAVAALAALGRAAGEADVREVLATLPMSLPEQLRHPQVALSAWSALAASDAPGIEASATSLARLIGEGADHTDTVLELAELQHAAKPDVRTGEVLLRAGTRLASLQVPLELRARGALDAAGVLASRGELARAEELLTPLLGDPPKLTSRVERELLELAHSYLLILRARGTRDAKERAEYLAKLKERSGPTALVDTWRALWVTELGRLPQKAACRGDAACLTAISKRGQPTEAALTAKVGGSAAKLLRRGVLGIRSADLGLSARSSGALSLSADFRPLWLAVEVPYAP
ncbi:MAG: hypothetical protein KIT72_04370 [Polyangiaceae bacterium]|nr:hypothetical protein [Polyangiaceae bacterium]MCW5789638.1 hypothetical protein [Polyangiaceae bacterium]